MSGWRQRPGQVWKWAQQGASEAVASALPVARRDQLVRLINGSLVSPPTSPLAAAFSAPLRRLGSRLWCGYRELKPLDRSLAGQKVCLFAHFDRDGLMEEYVVYHLARLCQAGIATILVTTAPAVAADEVRKISPYCAAILHRENRGLDFGSWRTALLAYPQIFDCSTLLLANDSVYGPMGQRGLEQVLAEMAASGCDFWGITESLQIRSHYQSYFLGFHRSCLRSPAGRDFLNGIRLLTDKDEIIQRYEVNLKSRLSAKGLRGAAVVPAGPTQTVSENPTLHRWEQSLLAGSPYLKVQLLRENPHQQPIDHWPQVVQSYGYDPGLIARHLRRFRSA